MFKGGEKHFFCIWFYVRTVLSVKPINDFAYKGFRKFDEGVIYGVWLTTVDAIIVCIYPISKEFFLCNDNPMIKFELGLSQLSFFACF